MHRGGGNPRLQNGLRHLLRRDRSWRVVVFRDRFETSPLGPLSLRFATNRDQGGIPSSDDSNVKESVALSCFSIQDLTPDVVRFVMESRVFIRVFLK